jgi:aminopeptidase N
MALPNAYPLVPVYDDEGWNAEIAPVYADDVYADVALYDVAVTAPADMVLVTSGTCDSTEAGRWSCQAAPMREFTLILGRDLELVNREVEGVVVNSYYYPRHATGGARALEVAVDALLAFNEMFGPYPYSELDVVETPNYLGGMEYPGLVVVGDAQYPTLSGLEWLTAHEVAHQWWFAVVGNDQIDDPWLDEALTQYSTMLYYESVYGRERADGILQSVFRGTEQMLVRSGQDQPIGLPAEEYPRARYWQIVYDKGALYFHELRQAVGDEAFFEILQTYYEQNRYGIATPPDLLAAIESVTGERHLDLYQKWVLGEG